MSSPAIAVIGLPALIDPIRQSGLELLSDEVEPAAVAQAARQAAAGKRTYVVLIAGDAPVLRVWAQVQTTQGRRVLWLRSDDLPVENVPEKARVLDLPASLNDVLAAFGATPIPDGDQLLIQSDGTVSERRPALRVVTGSDQEVQDDAGQGLDPDDDDDLYDVPPVAPRSVISGGGDPLADDEHDGDPAGEPEPLRTEVRRTAPPVFFEPPTPPPSKAKKRQCDVIVCFAGKGGVGKTTLSLALSQRAHVVGSLGKVVACDANRGQGDMRRILRVARSNLPSIYDSAITGDPKVALVTPKMLGSARHPNLPQLGIGVILAPDDAQADPHKVTAAVYRDAIAEVRSVADLVIVDTQIVEAKDLSGLIDGFVIPLLKNGAWGLGLTDSSISGADNLLRRLRDFDVKGVPRDRLMVAMNRKADESQISVEQLTEMTTRYAAAYVGTISSRPEVNRAFEEGTLPHDDGELSPVLDAVLSRVTGLAVFSEASAKHTQKRSFLSRIMRRS